MFSRNVHTSPLVGKVGNEEYWHQTILRFYLHVELFSEDFIDRASIMSG